MNVQKHLHYSKQFKSLFFYIIAIGLIYSLTGCMMRGMHLGQPSQNKPKNKAAMTSVSVTIDNMIKSAISDLAQYDQKINTIAVWDIPVQNSVIDPENLKQKIINHLVKENQFHVISRENLSRLLDEQSLSVNGNIDADNAVKIGKLIGVEGFIGGHLFVNKTSIELYLSLINSTTGVIDWSYSQSSDL